MITTGQIAEILSLYEKYGWQLRRILLTAETKNHLSDKTETLFGAKQIEISNLDAAWFSRKSTGGEAWELRGFTDSPFALIEVLNSNLTETERDEKLRMLEEKMLGRQINIKNKRSISP